MIFVLVRGEHENFRERPAQPQRPRGLDSRGAGELEIHQHQLGSRGADFVETLLARRGRSDQQHLGRRLEKFAHRAQLPGVVLDQIDPNRTTAAGRHFFAHSPSSEDFETLGACRYLLIGAMIDSSVALNKSQKSAELASSAIDVLRDPELHRLLHAPGLSGYDLPPSRQIYTNRALRLDQISMVGFDMDYTLAVYSMRHIEELAFRMTLERMVKTRGYPELLSSITYDHEFVIRGLVVDKDHGNLFKMDRHNYVGRCYHGRQLLPLDERRALYQNEKIRLSLPRFAWIDTLFSLPEACLYAEIIETLERRAPTGPIKVDYHQLYDDVRASIDEVHRDGSLKTELKKDLAKFIVKDPELGPTLHKLRSGGKKLFILTNSFWDYTDAVMSYLLEGQLPEYPSWRNYFDLVIVGAQKPAFFQEPRPFVELDAAGNVANDKATSLERGKVYEGGNLFDFERMTGHAGESVLYVGDHIYGDIIRNRKSSLWRTCFVVQELEREIDYIEHHQDQIVRLRELDHTRQKIDDLINHLKLSLNALDRAQARGTLVLRRTRRSAARSKSGVGDAAPHLQAPDRRGADARGHGRARDEPLLGPRLQRGKRELAVRRAGRELRRSLYQPRLQLSLLFADADVPQPARYDAA